MERYKKANLVSILGIVGNIFLLIIKAIVGFITHSQAMISDAFNSATDIFSSIMTFIGNKIASKKPDADHNLGHGKAEYIFSLIISLSMILVALMLIYSSIRSIFVNTNYNFSIYLVIVSVITIITKMSLFLYTNAIAIKYNNLLIKANSKDHINDVYLTSLNLMAAIFGYYNISLVDSMVGLLLALWIIKTGISIFFESYDVLMDKAMDPKLKRRIIKIVKEHDEIIDYNHFNSTPIGFQYQVSLTIFVDGNLSTFKSHEIANALEKEISSLDEIFLTVIHVNPK